MKKFIYNVIFCVVLLQSLHLFAQQSIIYEARLLNDQIVSPNQYEFDIFVKHIGGRDTFEVFGLQVALLVNDSIRNGGILNVSYIAGTSQMKPSQTPQNLSISNSISGWQIIKIPAQIEFIQGQGTIIGKSGNGTCLGRFRISTSAVAFANYSSNITWAFNSSLYGYNTEFNAWIDDEPIDITDPNSHSSSLQNNPLPVELKSFALISKGRSVTLTWQTKTEINTSVFEIQRQSLINNKFGEWIKIGSVNASGNSNSPKDYSYLDSDLNTGIYRYRLKSIDNDGSYSFSEILEAKIELPKEYSISQNYPNPFNPTTKIDYQLPYDSKVVLEIYDIVGEYIVTLINTDMKAGYYTINIDANSLNLVSGVYMYRLIAENLSNSSFGRFVQVKKLTLIK